MNVINWDQILGECAGYKDGFVAVFRRHEGESTDERDTSNRVVKVTMSSFADHLGIAQSTFKRWVKAAEVGASAVRTSRSKNDLTRDVLRAARHEPEAVVDAIMTAPEKVQDQIYDELKLRRAGVDTSPAAKKGAQARAHQEVEPILQSLATNDLVLCVAALNDAAEHLQTAISAGALDDDWMAKITAAHEKFAFTLTEARFHVS